MNRGEPKPEPSAFIYALKTPYATNIWLSSVKEKMEWNYFILTFLFSVCYKFENMLKVYIFYLNCALDSKFGHCLGIKVLDVAKIYKL